MSESASESDLPYPASPADVPPELRRPSARYQRHARMATASVIGFLVAYLGLTAWFAWGGVHLLVGAFTPPNGALRGMVGGAALLATAVMLGGFVPRRRHVAMPPGVEIGPADQPQLFAFIRRVAAELDAPAPDRVVVVTDVTAAAIADPGPWWRPGRRRRVLVLGLGALDGIDLRELKALVAHEVGHLGHHTTAGGRWSARAMALVQRLVTPQPWLTMKTVEAAARLPAARVLAVLPLAAIAINWPVRALTTTLFGWVLRTDLAFAREQELAADRAAASVAGSDAVATLLHRLRALDHAHAMAQAFVVREASHGRGVADVIAVQRRFAAARAALVPSLGGPPPAPVGDPAAHRVFTPELASLPTTWAAHPDHHEREASVKAPYVAAPVDPRPAWAVFVGVERLCADATAARTRAAGRVLAAPPLAQTLDVLDGELGRPHLALRYRGLYLEDALAAIDAPAAPPLDGPPLAAVATLYPPSLGDDLLTYQRLQRDRASLDGLIAGALTAPGGATLTYRERTYARAELPALRAAVETELLATATRIGAEEQRARAVHVALAERSAPAWADHLRSLRVLWRWAGGQRDDLAAALGAVHDAARPIALQRHRHADLVRFGDVGTALTARAAGLQAQLGDLHLPAAVQARLTRQPWFAAFGAPVPPPPRFGDFMGWTAAVTAILDGWQGALDDLAAAALDALLVAEGHLVVAVSGGDADPPALEPARVSPAPPSRALTVPAAQPPSRRAQRRRRAAAAGRVVAALGLVGGLAIATHVLRRVEIVAYNGTGGPVDVTIDGERHRLAAGDHARYRVTAGRIAVRARTADGHTIESFNPRVDEFHRYVYDVGAALPLVTRTIVYARTPGDGPDPTSTRRPPRRFEAVDVDLLFEAAPTEVKVDKYKDSATRSLLTAPASEAPYDVLDELAPADAAAVIAAQLRWRPTTAPVAAAWWAYDRQLAAEVLPVRLREAPDDIALRTVEQELAGDRRDAVCADHRQRAAAHPDDAGWQALAAACADDADARIAAWRALAARQPTSPWAQLGAGRAAAAVGDFAAAQAQLEAACRGLGAWCGDFAGEVARVRRAAHGEGISLDDLPLAGGRDGMAINPDPDAWWVALHHGRRADSLKAATAVGDETYLRWLIAGSVGAGAAELDAAEASPEAAMEPNLALVAYAARRRAGRAAATDLDEAIHAATADRGAGAPLEATALRGFLTLLVAADGPHPDAAAAALAGVGPVVRGRADVAAAIILGDACPPAWRAEAARLLFPFERPDLGTR